VAMDRQFPDGQKPPFADQQLFLAAQILTEQLELAPLRATYYHFAVEGDEVKKVILRFKKLSPRDALDVDGIVKIGTQPFERRDWNGKDEVTFCRSRPAEKLTDLYLVLSNHALALDQPIGGSFEIEASKEPCADYQGSVSLTQSGPLSFTATAQIGFVLELVDKDPDGRSTMLHYQLAEGSTVTLTSPLDTPDTICTVDPPTGPVQASGTRTLWINLLDPSFPKDSYSWAFAAGWPATLTCTDKRTGKTTTAAGASPGIFFGITDGCATIGWLPLQDAARLKDSWTFDCGGIAVQASWDFVAQPPN